MVEQIRNDLGSLVVNEERLKEANTKIKTRVVIFGLISVAVMGASTYL
jgi:nitrate reductase NapE component